MNREIKTIDATDRSLGRLAAEISLILRGKDKPEYAPNKDIGSEVKVVNFSKVRITGLKQEQKMYYRHSGFMGGLTETPMNKMKPEQTLKYAVLGMMPKNKLRRKQIKRLTIEL